MRELKATNKITQKMTRDGAVSENLATGEVEHISSREPETELSASSEESAGTAADLALRAAEHHEKKAARKAEKADAQAVRDGSAARQRPSSRLQFTEEERADPALGKYIDRSDRAADRLDVAKAAIPTKKVLRTERVFDETAGKGKTQLHFEEVEKRPNGRLRHNPLSRPVHEIVHAAHRGEKIVTIFVNNAIYGMTGGQMAPTTLIGQKTTTSPYGRDEAWCGAPIKMSEMLAAVPSSYYIERVAVNNTANIVKAKKAIAKAFRYQKEGKGFCMVEVLSTCPTNWGMSPVEAMTWLEENMIPYYPLGVYKDKEAK